MGEGIWQRTKKSDRETEKCKPQDLIEKTEFRKETSCSPRKEARSTTGCRGEGRDNGKQLSLIKGKFEGDLTQDLESESLFNRCMAYIIEIHH